MIVIAKQKSLFDDPIDDRKIHITRTPNLGGVTIFFTTMLTALFFIPADSIPGLHQILVACGVIFLTGLTDDLIGLSPGKKIISQLFVALIITIGAGFRINGLFGFLGLHDLNYFLSLALSILFVLLIVNAFNLIDGINGLAAALGLIFTLFFAFVFYHSHDAGYFYLAIALAGSLAGFLVFNWTPAKIFMGDTGSLFIGSLAVIFSLRIMNLMQHGSIIQAGNFAVSPAMILAVFIVPLYDTIRIFILRIMKGRSPFFADRNHIHHKLIDLGFTHMQSTGLLVASTLASVFITWALTYGGITIQIVGLIVTSSGLYACLLLRRSPSGHVRRIIQIPAIKSEVQVLTQDKTSKEAVLQ